jgi:hypothetical protein
MSPTMVSVPLILLQRTTNSLQPWNIMRMMTVLLTPLLGQNGPTHRCMEPHLESSNLADERKVGGARAFAAKAPEFVSDITSCTHDRVIGSGDTQGSHFHASADTAEPHLHCWKNNHVVNAFQEWDSLKGLLPNLASITDVVKIKHSACDVFTRKMSSTSGGLDAQNRVLSVQIRRRHPSLECPRRNVHLGLARPKLECVRVLRRENPGR